MKIRLWKMGDLDKQIVPTKDAVNKLKDILADVKNDSGFVDIVWGPGLTVEEYEVANVDGCPVSIICDAASAEKLRDLFKTYTKEYVDNQINIAIGKFIRTNNLNITGRLDIKE